VRDQIFLNFPRGRLVDTRIEGGAEEQGHSRAKGESYGGGTWSRITTQSQDFPECWRTWKKISSEGGFDSGGRKVAPGRWVRSVYAEENANLSSKGKLLSLPKKAAGAGKRHIIERKPWGLMFMTRSVHE